MNSSGSKGLTDSALHVKHTKCKYMPRNMSNTLVYIKNKRTGLLPQKLEHIPMFTCKAVIQIIHKDQPTHKSARKLLVPEDKTSQTVRSLVLNN